MNKTKEIFVFGFAIFAGFFGAGNLILPPLLGFNSGPDWWIVALGFLASATVIPLLALIAHARLQGTMLDFGNKVSPMFSLVFCLFVYVIAIALPFPRTAAVTHEMSIAPYFGIPSLLTSSIYFFLVFLFAINRGKVISLLGKYLTPFIGIIVLAIIFIGIFSTSGAVNPSIIETPVVNGFLEGYQTYDAIGGLVMGGVVVISINIKSSENFGDKKKLIAKSSGVAMFGLLLIYVGLIAVGAKYNAEFPADISRSELLSGLANSTLGSIGESFLSVLVALACFTTAVGIVVGTADFFKGIFNESKKVYLITLVLSCLIGVIVGQMNVKYIIDIALPVLMFIYPLVIVLVFLNVISKKWASKLVFRAVVLVTFVFSIPDFLGFLMTADWLTDLKNFLPLANRNLGWVLPVLVTFILINLLAKPKPD
ncbi:MAG: branched-chain amino acid transport system II carrier protein [Flavobacteriaceae bacterium]|nr:branched-chain amino acid transport system II carrier protein [Flavobacteriaceae bacterium]